MKAWIMILAMLTSQFFAMNSSADTSQQDEVTFSPQEITTIRSFGPWPIELQADPSNRFSQQAQAIELGRQLFFDRRLSREGELSCADCHQPTQAFQDDIALNKGLNTLHRNTSSLLNLAHRPWYGWGGEHDSLWSQSIRPMLSASEMHTDLARLKSQLQQDKYFQCAFEQTTGQTIDSLDQDAWLVSLGKLLASYQETIRSGLSPFDHFREQLIASAVNSKAIVPEQSALSVQQQQGLKIFIGEGRCQLCHSGPQFSSGEFGDIGVRFFTAEGVDKGRYQGIQSLKDDPFSLLGQYNDDETKNNSLRTSHLQLLHRNWGEFKIPSLRNVAQTAPYMHNGSLNNLAQVIDFYSELDEERLHADGEKILRPLYLSATEKQALESFLTSLTGPVMAATDNSTIFQQCQIHSP